MDVRMADEFQPYDAHPAASGDPEGLGWNVLDLTGGRSSISSVDRQALAQEILRIVEQGHYVRPDGERVEVAALVNAARDSTRLYRPEALQSLLELPAPPLGPSPRIEVTPESTFGAARRLVLSEGIPDVVALNFASAWNPGGGWLGGAEAQEEDLAISSALVSCQWKVLEFYAANRACPSVLYTDHIIHSSQVPFFRGEQGILLESPIPVSIITAPAPHAGEHLRRHPDDIEGLRSAIHRRSGMILSVARDRGHRTLVLGAWGCGAFGNSPGDVAESFRRWIFEPRFAGVFDLIVFAILDRSDHRRTIAPFERVFSSSNPLPPK
jgi:uncharacterized protein (TIGR02452 family)